MYQNKHIIISIIINMQKQLNIKDINRRFVKNIRFCWIGYSGCLGYSGYVFFMNKKGILYSCNYDSQESNEYINPKELGKRFKRYGLDFDLNRISLINNWDSFYLGGCGNYLYVSPKNALDFYRFAYGRTCVELYKNWQDVARYILCTK